MVPFHGFSARPIRGVFSYTRCKRIRTPPPPARASRENCPCFQFARLLRSRPSGVRGPVLLPPTMKLAAPARAQGVHCSFFDHPPPSLPLAPALLARPGHLRGRDRHRRRNTYVPLT